MKANQRRIGEVNGQDIFCSELTNGNNVKVCISNFGATITAILVPDKKGSITNTVLAYDSPDECLDDRFYIGATVGRVAGRISKGAFSIENKVYRLPQNDGNSGNHLHGGIDGFNKRIFEIESLDCNDQNAAVQMYYRSNDREEGYPGNLDVWVTFELTEENELIIRYKAQTDKPTHVNLTNHSYFNLGGANGNALEQTLFVNADKFLVTDENYIPTGKTKEVKDTLNDFRSPKKINAYNLQESANGYNGYFILNRDKSKYDELPDAILFDPVTERKMEVITSLPGLVFYSGEYLSGKFDKFAGVCLETQFFPDTPNRPEFNGTLLMPGQTYNEYTVLKFSYG